MKSLSVVLACVLCLVGCRAPSGPVVGAIPPEPYQVPQRPRNLLTAPLVSTNWETSVLQIVKLQHPIAMKCGSGTPIACIFDKEAKEWRTYILTARHVVEPYDGGWEIHYGAEGRFGGDAYVVEQHKSEDVAIVCVPSATPTLIVPMEPVPVRLAQPITVVGYPNCMRRVITAGFVGESGAASAAVFPGNSGGPVLDHSGHLVGVVRAIGLGPKNLLGERIMVTHDMLFSPLSLYLEWIISCLNKVR